MSDAAAKRRAKQTINNLVLSLIACLGFVLVLVLIVPRDDTPRHKKVDYVAVAKDAEASSAKNLFEPNLENGWWSNAARWSKGADSVATWYLGLVGGKNQFIGVTQAFDHNPTWLALQTTNYQPDGQAPEIAENWMKWRLAPNQKGDPTIWTIEFANQAFVLDGTAEPTEFAEIAAQIEEEFGNE